EKGKLKVISEGEEGIAVKTYEVTNEDGKPAEKNLIDTKVKKESKNKVVAVGTKEEVKESNVVTLFNEKSTEQKESESSSKSNSLNGNGKTLTMSASSYTAKCNGCSCYTSTGINLNANPNKKVVAVDTNVIPLGTKVWVEG